MKKVLISLAAMIMLSQPAFATCDCDQPKKHPRWAFVGKVVRVSLMLATPIIYLIGVL